LGIRRSDWFEEKSSRRAARMLPRLGYPGYREAQPWNTLFMHAPATPAERLVVEAMPPARIFLSLQGRISRRMFWRYGVLALLALGLLGMALLRIAGLSQIHAEGVVNMLLLWPAIAVSAKRWHDRDRSAWWVAVALIPVIGWLWALIDNGCMRGTRGPNRYGPDPLAGSSLMSRPS
jgi:uncharacterized membrane protein YhaH (DUF805 family)